VPPERNYKGKELDAGVNIRGAHLKGIHLRLPGWGENGPTLEIYSYNVHKKKPKTAVNRPGFTHIAFEVDNVEPALKKVLASGGNKVGEIVTLTTSAESKVTWCYLTDPEGNIIELQKWNR
jgi:catechol 2,3-dioxygenase-like lactoylglutathione lyase family enzyme